MDFWNQNDGHWQYLVQWTWYDVRYHWTKYSLGFQVDSLLHHIQSSGQDILIGGMVGFKNRNLLYFIFPMIVYMNWTSRWSTWDGGVIIRLLNAIWISIAWNICGHGIWFLVMQFWSLAMEIWFSYYYYTLHPRI